MKTNSDELKTFIVVVEQNSFSKAAIILNQDTSAVSRTIKKLEMKLETTLLTRTTRRINLTQEGTWLYEKASAIINDIKSIESYLLKDKENPRGTLHINAATPFIFHVLAPLVSDFNKTYPNIVLTLQSSETFVNLLESRVDVAIRIGELVDSTLRCRSIGVTYRHIVASPKYLKKYGQPSATAELEQHRCLGFTSPSHLNQWPVRNHIDELLTITPNMVSNSGELLRKLCLEGNGIACLSDFMIQADLESGALVSILDKQRLNISMPIHAVYYSDRGADNRIRCFLDFICEKMVTSNIIHPVL